jgi:hypothetical protein
VEEHAVPELPGLGQLLLLARRLVEAIDADRRLLSVRFRVDGYSTQEQIKAPDCGECNR